MKTLLVILTITAVAGFLWVSSSSIDPPSTWSVADSLEYRWYVFKDKLGIEMGSEQHARFRKMIDEALNAAREIGSVGGAGAWLGHIYPDRGDLGRAIGIGRFETLEACRSAARDRLASIGAGSDGDYECGRNCVLKNPRPEIWVCDETRQ